MSEAIKMVKLSVLENSIDTCLRKAHIEYATAVERSVAFFSSSSTDAAVAVTSLRNGDVDGILVSPMLVGQITIDGVDLDTASKVVRGYNLLKISNNVLCAVNTDVLGVHHAMTSRCVNTDFRAVLVIGTGPLVRAALYCLVHYFKTHVIHVYEESENAFNDLKSSIVCHNNDVTVLRQQHATSSPAKNIFINLGRFPSESDPSMWSQMALRGGWGEISLELVEKFQAQIMWQHITDCDNDLVFHEYSWEKDGKV
ncbi:hypothetical protein K435DRAFT_864267 [Dendrothele bispora CBS 962.96]|uniref:NAD(P)-binding protein n=1 Tax=Dendrothele bispora (strain CBS 962.96) TaxID=1314807 RepID=A0A4S8LNV8_DENBC|nr:hypothetical protein K435DRAFT_864267 [Dendrothele bispora CBS 962.96]